MIRVLLLSNMHPSERWPSYGPFVKAHADALARRGDIRLRRVVITEPRKGWRTPVKYARFFARAWWRGVTRRFDIVHVHYAHPTAIGALPGLWRGARLVITAHGGDVNEMLAARAPASTRRAFLRADHIIAVSENLAGKLRERLGSACPPITVQNMGVDLSRFFSAGEDPRAAPQSPPRLLFVGRLIDRKGVDLLLRALAGLDMPWRLDVVGDGPRRAALEQQARTGGLGDRVTFHGARPPEEIPNWCRGADLFIGPSREEPLGLVFLEAAACGCPVVATRSGGIPEILADGESALLVPPEDVDGLRATIRRALTDEALRRRLIDGGLSAAHGNSLDRSIDRTLVVYHRVLSS